MAENSRETFIFYRSFYDAILDLPDEQQLVIFRAITDYSFTLKEPKLEGICSTIFKLIKPQIEANNRRFLNGKKGAIKKQNESKTKANTKQSESKSKANNNNNNNNNNNDSNKKTKAKKDFVYELPEFIDGDLFKAFIDSRMSMPAKDQLTQTGVNLAISKLTKFHNEGEDIKLIVENTIFHRWKGFFKIKDGDKNENNTGSASEFTGNANYRKPTEFEECEAAIARVAEKYGIAK